VLPEMFPAAGGQAGDISGCGSPSHGERRVANSLGLILVVSVKPGSGLTRVKPGQLSQWWSTTREGIHCLKFVETIILWFYV
jgi:hypothetical protein